MADEKETPKQITLQQEDILRLLLLNEKRRRIEVEQAALCAENENLIGRLNARYGVDLTRYSLSLDSGIATLRE
jgi:hypothetical protein